MMGPSRSSLGLYADAGCSRQLPATGAHMVRSPTSFSTRTVGLCERFSLIQSLCRHEPRPPPKGAGSNVETPIIRKPLRTLLPLPWPSPRRTDCKTQRLLIDLHTSFPSSKWLCLLYITFPDKHLFVPFHPNQILCSLHSHLLTHVASMPPDADARMGRNSRVSMLSSAR